MERVTSSSVSSTTKINEYDRLQQILDKVRDLKQSLGNFFNEYEDGQPSWPTILDEMNVLSSQIKTLRTSVRHTLPSLRAHAIIPMCLSPDNDPNVEQLTERRMSIFNHDFMPQLLRTKNLPEIEERERLLITNPNNVPFGRSNGPNDFFARVQDSNAFLDHIGDVLKQTRDATDKSEKQFDLQRFNNQTEAKRLLEAMNYGVGLKAADTSSSSPVTTNEQTNLNQPMAGQPQRPAAPTVRIKTISKPNR